MICRIVLRMVLLVASLFIVHLLSATAAEQCGTEYSIFGMMLMRHNFKTMKTSSAMECLHACRNDVRCQSLNYVMGEDSCELNDRTNKARPEHFVPDLFRYYLTRDKNRVPLGSIPEVPAETCREIKLSEGHTISGSYWLNSIVNGKSLLAQCDMETEDVDECSADVHICGSNANCTNTNGSYYCSCHSGFTRSGKECVDIDECTAGVHTCLRGTATCINTIGSYNCSCNLGYVGDGRTSCYVQSAECQNPASLTEANRKETFTGVLLCDNSLGPNWFRFQGAAGNKMAATCVPTHRCGTHATGWLNGVHPTVSEGIVTRQVCFNWSGGCCVWSINIQSVQTTKFWTVLTETLITKQGGNVTTISSEDGSVSPEQQVQGWLPDRASQGRCNSQLSVWLNGKYPSVADGMVISSSDRFWRYSPRSDKVLIHGTGRPCDYDLVMGKALREGKASNTVYSEKME